MGAAWHTLLGDVRLVVVKLVSVVIAAMDTCLRRVLFRRYLPGSRLTQRSNCSKLRDFVGEAQRCHHHAKYLLP